jgi:hypothetical protein
MSAPNEKWFYSDPAKVVLHNTEAISWRGTPFVGRGRSKGKGGGIDCVGFIEENHAAAGIERFNFPREEGDFHPHNHNDKILNFLRGKATIDNGLAPDEPQVVKSGNVTISVESPAAEKRVIDPQSKILAARFAELNVEEMFEKSKTWPHPIMTRLMPGDMVIMRGGIGIWHITSMLDERNFIHCAWPGGVTQPTDITPPNYQKAVKAIFRARLLPNES